MNGLWNKRLTPKATAIDLRGDSNGVRGHLLLYSGGAWS